MDLIEKWLEDPELSFIIIYVFTAIIYKLSFARPLPILKTIIIYLVLGIGCMIFTVFHGLGLPIVPGLTIALVIIVLFRAKMYVDKKNSKNQS